MRDDTRNQPWARALQDVLAALPGLVSDRLELLALELQRAGHSLVQITALGLATAVLGATAWLTLCAAAALALLGQGLSWPVALLAVLLVNLVLAWAAVSRMRSLLANLGLPATRRHLVFGAGVAPTAGVLLHQQAGDSRPAPTP